jgi:CheY-like chemotaxis protein
MQRQNVRVILASEYPRVRNFLREVVEEEPGAIIIGQAETASKALTLARTLRPDVAIIDGGLPHTVGLDAVPLSRIGGLDTAQTTSEEIPNARVILLNNLDAEASTEGSLSSEGAALFSREIMGASVPFTLQELCLEAEMPGGLVFASVQSRPGISLRHKVASLSDKAVLFGGLGMLGGLILMLTVVLSEAGFILAIAGATTMFLGMVGKVTASLRHKAPQETDTATRD